MSNRESCKGTTHTRRSNRGLRKRLQKFEISAEEPSLLQSIDPSSFIFEPSSNDKMVGDKPRCPGTPQAQRLAKPSLYITFLKYISRTCPSSFQKQPLMEEALLTTFFSLRPQISIREFLVPSAKRCLLMRLPATHVQILDRSPLVPHRNVANQKVSSVRLTFNAI